MRYKANPEPIRKYIGAVDQFDIYLSRGGGRYVVRWGNQSFITFHVGDGVPSPETLIAVIPGMKGEDAYDQAVRVSKMIELFGQP